LIGFIGTAEVGPVSKRSILELFNKFLVLQLYLPRIA